MLPAALPEYVFIRVHVVVPILPFLEVLRVNFPVLLGMIETSLQTISLLILADVKEEFRMIVPSSLASCSKRLMWS